MPKAELGVALDDDFPDIGKCMIHCNTTCDTSLMGNSIEDMIYGKPSFALAAPEHIEDDLVMEYAVDEIRDAIRFIEEQTGEKWDWDYYFECARRVNVATRCRNEWLDMNKTAYPQVFGSNLALYTETNYMAICGKVPEFEKADRRLMKLAEKAYRKQKMAATVAIVWDGTML
jgi:benzoyl-CoA reductase/2-hydroxyglutaryl-CoA dehydratase subunit BcrC/BadD/HgdB